MATTEGEKTASGWKEIKALTRLSERTLKEYVKHRGLKIESLCGRVSLPYSEWARFKAENTRPLAEVMAARAASAVAA